MSNVSWNESCPFSFQFDPYSVRSFPPSAIPTWIAVSTINSISALLSFYINLLVIWTIFKRENLRSLNYNLLLAILSLTDLLVGLVVQPLFVTNHLCIIVQCTQLCSVHSAFVVSSIMCIGWSFSTLVIICVDRYLYIEYPMYYTAVVTTKKLKVATAITWPVILVIILFGRVIFKDSDKTRVLLEVLIIALGVVIIVFCLTKVSLTAHRQTRTISIQQATFQQTNNSVLDRIKEAKRTFTLGSIVLASALLYCPFVIINIITGIKGQGDNADFKYISRSIALTCLHFRSLLNPFILSLRLSPIREGVTTKMRAHLAWLVP